MSGASLVETARPSAARPVRAERVRVDRLAAQPDSANLRVSAHSWDILAGLVPSDGEPLREGVPDDADYIVTYGRRIQMHRWGPSLDRYFAANPPVYIVTINGIEYVHVHPGPHRGRAP